MGSTAAREDRLRRCFDHRPGICVARPLPELDQGASPQGLCVSLSLEGASRHEADPPVFRVLTAVSLNFLTDFCRAYLTQGSQEHLLKVLKSAFKDLIDVFPAGQKNRAALEAHFKAQGMGFVGEWYTKRVATLVKEEMSRFVVSSLDDEDVYSEEWTENVSSYLLSTLLLDS